MTTKAEKLVKRIQEANEDFQSTFCKGKFYSNEEMAAKRKRLKKVEKANKKWDKFLGLCRRIRYPYVLFL